jgi:putative hydrolase of the HAD superfamily
VLRVAELESRVDSLVLSFRVGSCKPSPAIFRAALESLGVSARDAVFADDRPEHLAGAAALGIDGILVEDTASFAAGLERAGLLPPGTAGAGR